MLLDRGELSLFFSGFGIWGMGMIGATWRGALSLDEPEALGVIFYLGLGANTELMSSCYGVSWLILIASRMLGFAIGSMTAGVVVYKYVLEEYRVSNELLTEDVYVCHSLALPLRLNLFPYPN